MISRIANPSATFTSSGFPPERRELGKFDPAKQDTDHPPHEVTFTRDYWLQDTEVSVAQFRPFVVEELGFESFEDWKQESGFSDEVSPTDQHPVQSVSWLEAVRFCNWLSRKHGLREAYRKLDEPFVEQQADGSDWRIPHYQLVPDADGFRLPTDAEWEFASRRHSTTLFFFGEDESYFNFYGIGSSRRLIEALPVRSLKPNAHGLYGMLGNVWEWTHDRYAPGTTEPSVDPRGPSTYLRGSVGHVHQGGGINTTSGGIDSESRGFAPPTATYSNLGFRVAR